MKLCVWCPRYYDGLKTLIGVNREPCLTRLIIVALIVETGDGYTIANQSIPHWNVCPNNSMCLMEKRAECKTHFLTGPLCSFILTLIFVHRLLSSVS